MSWQNSLFSWMLRKQWHPETVPITIEVMKHRAMTQAPVSTPRLPDGWQIRPHHQGALQGEWIEPKPELTLPRSLRVVLYLHGGGYYFCSPRTHQALTCALARYGQAKIFSLAYPLAPEHPFPAAVDAAVAACQALYAEGLRPADLLIAGDSAGGGLAVATMVALRDAGLPLPAGGVLFSPWTDLACTGESLKSNAARDVMFNGTAVEMVAKIYLNGTDPRNPLASPLYADLSGLPPLFIQASDSEVLLDDARRLADKAQAQGVRVQCKIWPKLPHVWQLLVTYLPEARKALSEAGDFIQGRTP